MLKTEMSSMLELQLHRQTPVRAIDEKMFEKY